MKNKNIVFLILFVAIMCGSSCLRFIQSHDTGIWFYTYNSSANASSEFNLTPASFICLQPDNNYTLDFGKFDNGKWLKKGDTIVLNSASGSTTAFIINYRSGKELKLNIAPGVVCDFEMQPYSFSANSPMPFSLKDNAWRIKATHKETASEIQTKLVSHCRFWKDYFTWALDNSLNTVDVRSTPTPIKIYGNGFALKTYNDLPATWINYFYDSADCMAANKILEDVFNHNDIAWAHTDNKYKMFIGAFEQLERFLDDKIAQAKLKTHF